METTTSAKIGKTRSWLHLDWLLQLVINPGKILSLILSEKKSNWQTPLLVLSIAGIVEAIAAGPIRKAAIEMGTNLPPGFEYYTPDQQQQFMQAQASQSSPLFLYVFPILGVLLGILITWFLLRSLLHFSLTLAGSRGKSILSGNLAAWSAMPLIIRSIVRIVAMLSTHSLINSRGLSGLVTATNGAGNYLAAVLALIDLYFFWQAVLILIGAEKISGLPKVKAWGASAIAILILVLIQALPGFLSTQLSGLSITRMFF
jgi:hypothetical protein